MPKQIAMSISARYTDPLIQQVKATAGAKPNRIPFLLLPVRIETRFMKAERPIAALENANLLSEILQQLADIDIYLLEDIELSGSAGQQEFIGKFSEDLTDTANKVERLEKVTAEQKYWLNSLFNSILRRGREIAAKMRGTSGQSIKNTLQYFTGVLNNLSADAPTPTQNALDFLDKMKKLERNLSIFTQRKTPYTSKSKKKKLYQLVDRRINESNYFYRPRLDKIEQIGYLESNQIQVVRNLHKKIKKHLDQLPENILELHQDNNWIAFVKSRAHLIQKDFPSLFEHFEKVIIPKLTRVDALAYVEANKYLFNSLNVKRAVEKFNRAQIKGYGDIKGFRKHLQHKMEQLEKYQSKTISGSPEQRNLIQNQWAIINTSLAKSKRKASGADRLNQSQQFGLGKSFQFIDFLTNESPVNLTNTVHTNFSNRTELDQGFKITQHSLEVIKGLQLKIRAGQKINEADIKALSQVQHSLLIAQRKQSRFTKSDIQSFSREIDRLNHRQLRPNFSSSKVSNQYGDLLKGIRQSLNALEEHIMPLGRERGIQFVAATEIKNELWVRIYPDDIFVHTHEPNLTEAELANGKRYWKTIWAVSGDKDLQMGAWRSLCASHGSRRAAWIVKLLDGQKQPRNSTVLRKSPSRELHASVQSLETIAQQLKAVKKGGTITQIRDKIPLQIISQSLERITNDYQRIRPRPQLQFFMEKAVGLKQRIYSKLKVISEIAGSLSNPAPFESTLTQISLLFQNFELMQAPFAEIKVLRSDEFLEQLQDPYVYPDSATLETKDADWTVAPHSRVLPRRFAVVTRNNGQFQNIKVGNAIPDRLQIGLDPNTFNFEEETDNPFQIDENGELIVEEGMRWMVDFNEAVEKGMGIIVPLDESQAENGFDEVFVLGISDNSVAEDTKLLEELLENHHYAPDGMEFLKIGTATNNTESVEAGYTSDDLAPEESYAIEMEAPLFTEGQATDEYTIPDGERLANALGISSSHFQHIKNSGVNQIGQAKAMHKALWHSTIGGYMEDMWDKVFTYDNIERTWDFFTQHVMARGPLPSIRVGSQPYGILPVTAFKSIRFHSSFGQFNLPKLNQGQLENPGTGTQQTLQLRFDIRMQSLFEKLHDQWSAIRRSQVNHAGNMESTEDPQAAFIDMLGLNASSTDFFFRYGVNINDRTAGQMADIGTNFEDTVVYSPYTIHSRYKDLLEKGYFLPSFRWDDVTDPNLDDGEVQMTRKNSRVRDQFFSSRIFTFRYLNRHSIVDGEWISTAEDSEMLPAVGDADNYINWLLDPGKSVYFDIFNDNNVKELPSQSILFLLLRQSLLLSYREASLQILQHEGFFTENFRRLLGSKEFYISRTHAQFKTKWSYLLRRLVDLDSSFFFNGEDIDVKPLFTHLKNRGDKALADYITNAGIRNSFPGNNNHSPYLERVDEVKQAMQALSGISTKNLGSLLSEHLDLCTYRLDAWISGLANRRLMESRQSQTQGVYLGAYAWVENLRPGGAREEVTELPEDLVNPTEEVFTDEDNEGYIHAPSINHAITAAVLRSGYQANDDAEGDLTNRMAVNLTSARVRKALNLISGLRNGLDIASLLGFQFERGLHERYQEAELDKFILPFRKRFPLIVPIEVNAQDVAEDQHNNVVNGLDLLEKINEEIDDPDAAAQTSLYDYLTVNNFDNCPDWLKVFVEQNSDGNQVQINKELRAIIKEIDQMADAFDALGDVAISESVYQIVQGNHVRAAAMLSSLGDGTLMPEPQVVNTPRTGTVVTHKVLLHIQPTVNAPVDWAATMTPRAKAEPSLNHWIGEKIGSPENVRCLVKRVDNDQVLSITLNELNIQPIDLLFLLSGNREIGNPNLLDLITYQLRLRDAISSEVGLQCLYRARDDAWEKEVLSFYQLELLLMQVKELTHEARPIGYTDMSLPADEPDIDNPDKIDWASFQPRVNLIIGDAKQFCNILEAFIVAHPVLTSDSHFNKAYDHLVTAGNYGVTNLLAEISRSKDEQESEMLLPRLEKALELLKKRIEKAQEHQAKVEQLVNTQQKVTALVTAAKAILGESFTIIPQYQNPDTAVLQAQLDLPATESLLRNSQCIFPMDEWLQGIADVRSKMYALEMFNLVSKSIQVPLKPLAPIQLPYQEGDYWLGMDYPIDYLNDEDKLSLVFADPALAVSGVQQTGLVLDEWVEIIPNQQETTGIAFHYDQPDATPPQTILLATSPKPVTGNNTETWDWSDLVYTLMDTFEMARNRTVEPDHLENSIFGQILPSIISEVVPPQLLDSEEGEEGEEEGEQNVLGAQVVLDFADNLPEE